MGDRDVVDVVVSVVVLCVCVLMVLAGLVMRLMGNMTEGPVWLVFWAGLVVLVHSCWLTCARSL